MAERAFTWVKKSGGTSIVVSDVPFILPPGTMLLTRRTESRYGWFLWACRVLYWYDRDSDMVLLV